MLIRKIELQNFMSYENSVIELPKNGVVVITGVNGSGKSSIAEATATSVWGKTLRGSSPWVADKKGFSKVSVEIAGKIIEFTRQTTPKGKVSAKFDPSPANYATATKTQNAIDSLVGDFDTWRKCAVFSSQDAAHFTLATDAERKRLLESLLGLDKFDIALKTCRDEQKIITAKIRDLENTLTGRRTVKEFCEQSIEDNKVKLDHVREKAKIRGVDTKEDREKLKKDLSQDIDAHIEVTNMLRRSREEYYRFDAGKGELQKSLALLENDICPTCAQSLGGDAFLKAKKEKHKELEKVGVVMRALERERKDLEAEDIHLGKLVATTRDKLEGLLEFQSTDQGLLISHLEHEIGELEEKLKKSAGDHKEAEKQLEELQYDLALSENTQTVLGTKGVRAHILTSALGALEATSNKWLRKIASKNARISIRPYVENKSGGIRESISLDISGIGNGEGYKSLSGGQRRRVDVALLLGLSELAQASNQHTKGTVFFDEVFDSLDSEGVEAVGSVIEEMATDRPVIIISHSSSLVDSLSSCAHYVVENGEINLK